MHHSTYFGVNITRTIPGTYAMPGYRLPWSAYVGGRFVYADTLAGVRRLIKAGRA